MKTNSAFQGFLKNELVVTASAIAEDMNRKAAGKRLDAIQLSVILTSKKDMEEMIMTLKTLIPCFAGVTERKAQGCTCMNTGSGDFKNIGGYAGCPVHDPNHKEETVMELEQRTHRNMKLISTFVDYLKEQEAIELPESAVLSFFNA